MNNRPLDRRAPTLQPKARILVLCEGKVTEPEYIYGAIYSFRNSLVEVEVVRGGGVPKTLVEKAVVRKKEADALVQKTGDANLRFDQIWCVFDVDQHPKIPDAKQQARAHKIRLAISNPCIEIWLYIHFAEHHSWIDRKKLERKVKQCIPGYGKHIDAAKLLGSYKTAKTRAIALRAEHTRNQTKDDNPSTDFYKLIDEIERHGRS